MIVGSDPVDESIFVPRGTPGVYAAPFPSIVLGVVEMDGNQFRYRRVNTTKEYHVDKMDPIDIVTKLRSSFHYDETTKVLYLHTSDDKPATSHEIELQRRDNGIGMMGKHYVTAIGFTFRHQGDSGISFFIGSSDGVAINNTVWGSRQGIRVYGATNILAYGNTLFRNENCGIYFAKESLKGSAIHNILYENLLGGVRWSSSSKDGLAANNIVFDNLDRGILIEQTERIALSANELVNNKNSQILVRDSGYSSDLNCFQIGPDEPNQLIAEYWYVDRYRSLRPYQEEKQLDLDSREGNCAPLPAKVDVHKLNAEAAAYTERARRILNGAREAEKKNASAPTRSWLDWLLGR
jgi:parallel beta-helix repeat protein